MGRTLRTEPPGSLPSVVLSVIIINHDYSVSPPEKRDVRGGGHELLHGVPGLEQGFGRRCVGNIDQ